MVTMFRKRPRAARDPLGFDFSDEPAAGVSETVKKAGAIGALAAMAAGVGAWMVASDAHSRASLREERTLCLIHSTPPVAVLTMIDVTDPLAAGSGERFAGLLREARLALPRDGRFTVVPFNGELGGSLSPAFDRCSPGRGVEADEFMEGQNSVQRNYDREFVRVLDRAGRRVASAEASDFSPIAAQVMRAVNDPAIRWVGGRRELSIYTDGLEHTSQSRIYSGAPIRLPTPPPDLLRGVTVNFVELANPRFSHLQTPAVREAWRRWFEAAGAERINMRAEGYATPS